MVLARKYRPKGFDSMVGQGHVVQALSNALTQQRLHHAYLFTGTRGVGKTTVSRILAKSLNCVGPDGQGTITASPCGQCQPCRDIDAGRFVDYVELDAASNRGVEEISQLLEQAVYKPVVGRFKVYMIDEVHMLSNTAFNAMLKTLEEPPDYLKFVLATTDPQKVPVTVLSRCLQFNLRPMAAQTVHEHLGQVLQTEGIDFEPEALRLLARAARGSMRDAMSLADQAIAFGGGRLQEAPVRQMLGAVDRTHVQRIIEAVAAGDGAALVACAETLRQMGLSASGTLEELAAALQRMAVIQSVPDMAVSEDPDEAAWRRLAPLLASDETQLFYSLCLQGRAELALAPDEYSGLVMLLLRLLAFKPDSPLMREGASPPPKAEGSVAARRLPAEPRSAEVPAVRPPSASPVAVAPARPAAEAMRSMESAPPARPVASPVSARATMPAARAVDQASPNLAAPGDTRAPGPQPSSAGQGIAPWESLPPEADLAFGAEEAPAVVPPEFESDLPPPMVDVVAAPASAPAPSAQPARRLSFELPEPGSDPLSDAWADIVAQLHAKGAITALVRELAIQSQCTGRTQEDGRTMLHLRVERESLCGDGHRERLAQALSQHLGHEVCVALEKGPAFNTPAQRDQVAREKRQQQAEDLIGNDPLVRELLSQYPGTRLVPGSIRPV